jgi:hypothetical protein
VGQIHANQTFCINFHLQVPQNIVENQAAGDVIKSIFKLRTAPNDLGQPFGSPIQIRVPLLKGAAALQPGMQ